MPPPVLRRGWRTRGSAGSGGAWGGRLHGGQQGGQPPAHGARVAAGLEPVRAPSSCPTRCPTACSWSRSVPGGARTNRLGRMPDLAARARTLLDLHTAPEILVLANVWDVVS